MVYRQHLFSQHHFSFSGVPAICPREWNKHLRLRTTNVTEIQFNISTFKPQSRASINTSIREVSASAMMPQAASQCAKWPDLTKATTVTGVFETCFEQNFQNQKEHTCHMAMNMYEYVIIFF